MPIRFASIPKCASRTLEAYGLLGEVPGRWHTRITEYPEWEKYEWHVVLRPAPDWYASWWHEAKKHPDALTMAMGLQFRSMEEDLGKLNAPPKSPVTVPIRGFNSWVPPDFAEDYAVFLKSGGGFREYCYSVITCGLNCVPVLLCDLDAWLTEHEYRPIRVPGISRSQIQGLHSFHANARAY